jgi:hypothetical protein
MAKQDDSKYTVGYKKPPRNTRFKPGQSGNLKGRPKKTKTVEGVIKKEFFAPVTIVEDGKRRKVCKLEAIVKQHSNKAASGDPKSATMLFNELRFYKSDEGDNLGELLHQFRAVNASHLAADQDRIPTTDNDESNVRSGR